MPNLVKLKLTGLVDDENFAFGRKWLHLLELTPTLTRIVVKISLEHNRYSFHCEKLQMVLRDINLNLTCLDDDCDHYLSQRNIHRWWHLEGVIFRKH